MTRWNVLAAAVALVAIAAVTGTGCQSSGVGDPCTPEQEYDPSFLGFDIKEVSVESKSYQCMTRLCLVDHFQGRVSCPYGQQASGMPNAPATACMTPIGTAVTGKDSTGAFVDPIKMALVQPQCANRTAAAAVYCSCRCANVNGATNDGYNYCTCPDGFSCTQLVGSVGTGTNEGLTGAYCVKSSAQYNPLACTPSTQCSAAKGNCGTAQGVVAH
jgi:hypothetical protein